MGKFVPRQRKHKHRVREEEERQKAAAKVGVASASDANADVILPPAKAEKDKKREMMRDELRALQPQSKISKKKQKRMDKYIDNKLKKEENLDIMKKLAEFKTDTSLMQSARQLTHTSKSRREILARAAREKEAGIDVERNETILKDVSRPEKKDQGYHTDSDEEDDEKVENIQKKATNGSVAAPKQEEEHTKKKNPAASAASFGSGLKRPLELDDDGRPVIKKRKRAAKPNLKFTAPQTEPEWEGFSSEGGGSADDDDDSSASGWSAVSGEEEGSEDEEMEEEEGSDDEDDDEESLDEDESDESEDGAKKQEKKERSSAFKAWATAERNKTVGYTPSTNIEALPQLPAKPFQPRAPEEDPLPPELATKTATDAWRKAYSVTVERPEDVQEGRLKLPVVAEEQKIMEAIHNNDVVVVWGATGSGKTTQVPQFLFEAGYGDPNGPTPGVIGVTQPRRVAAVSMANRVGVELGSAGKRVGYQIRFDSSTGDDTAIKFMTDGILLREIAQDISLPGYSAIVIDEAHERSVNTDILIGMMSRIVDLRRNLMKEDPKVKPLKLVIMSATLRISDFTENTRLFRFGSPPLLKAEGRQYPVTVHFARRTRMDYIEEAFQKIKRGHRKLPPGGMLVFMTGQSEINTLAKRLKQEFPSTQGAEVKQPPVRISAADAPLEAEDLEIGDDKNPDDYDDGSDEDSEIHGLDDDDDKDFDIAEEGEETPTLKVHVLPLYSQLPTKQQMRIFESPPEGSRLIVLATNVAETSLTIPGIRYVFDCGRSKERIYDQTTGVQSFEVGWISKASAEQRAGRAGRTGPGHCYRFYSSAVYERDFKQYAEPEILRTPIEGLVLQLKSMGIHKVVNYPFPTSPDRQQLAKAEKLLQYLGAIDGDGKITPQGRQLSVYPLTPRFSRMLVIGQNHGLAAYVIALVSALAVPDVFVPENLLNLASEQVDDDHIRTHADNLEEEARDKRRRAYNSAHASLSQLDRTSDAAKLLAALCAFAAERKRTPEDFASDMFLRLKALQEATQLRQQLTNIVRKENPRCGIATYEPVLAPPTKDQLAKLNYIVAAGFVDLVAQRADLCPDRTTDLPSRKPKRATDVPYVTLFPSHDRDHHRHQPADAQTQYVFIHASSVLAHHPVKSLPQYVIYSHLQRAAPSSVGSSTVPKVRMHPLCAVTGAQLTALAKGTPLLQWGKPVGKIVDKGRDGEGRERRECYVVPSLVGEKGGLGWPLPAKRVVQRKEGGGKGWVLADVLG
ncbi:deah-box rna helicase [Diplodia corticola]|uniref:RNA helicase n=1 Tax=Diplodia corticola TaxID=236234 RepID=A0A1J9R7J0_9PEZI|nr:deah-box rna helicase [Diplodia corticola]OJD36552.1 deah-box rna helicase [Diplodia corticola]